MLSTGWLIAPLHSGGAQPLYVASTASLLVLAAALPWAAPRATAMPPRRRLAWVLAMAVLAAALLPPLEHLAESSLAAHMGQHVLLLFVVAPLLVVADPVTAAVRALPADRRRTAARRLAAVRRAGRLPGVVVALSAVHVGVVLGWHVPAAYTAAVQWSVLHAIEHAQFLVAGVVFWWLVRESARSRRATEMGAAWVGLAMVSVSGLLLGLLMTFSTDSWYPTYAGVAAWGLSAVEDQQAAGAIMWAAGGPAYVGAALMLLAGALRSGSRATDPEDSRRPVRSAR